MAAKFVVVLVAMAVSGQCSVVPLAKVDTDYSSFAYDVADPNTGDYKSQVETRSGGNVAGQYSLVDPDGTRRTVDYTADDLNGFNAVVRKDAAVVAAPIVAAAPAVVAARVAAPVVAAAPAVVAARIAAPVVAAAAPVVAARSYVAPTVYAASSPLVAHSYAAQYQPSVYSAHGVVAAPSVYSHGVVASAPVVARAYSYGAYPYSAYSAPLSYW